MPLEPGTDSSLHLSLGIPVETGVFLMGAELCLRRSRPDSPDLLLGCELRAGLQLVQISVAPLKPGIYAVIQRKASSLQKPVGQICS